MISARGASELLATALVADDACADSTATMRPHLLIGVLVLWTILAAPASAQLDLPDAPRGEEAERERPRRRSGVPGLDLPSTPPPGRASTPAPASSTEPTPGGGDAAVPGDLSEASTLLTELRRLGSADRAREAEYAEKFLALGEPGLAALRGALTSKSALVRVTAQRVLLTSGLETDRALVLNALHGRVPGRSASALLQGLAELDPVAASPELYLELLNHSQASMRAAAASLLAVDLDESRLGDLVQLSSSRYADTRLHAIELASALDSTASTDLMFNGLADTDGRVASQAARALARSRDESVEPRLLELVSASTSFTRLDSYALLAIVEREDLHGRAILSSDSTDVLLRNLAEGIDLAVGASACALAGIGFRSDRSTPSQWLELLVPHHLVRIVSGTEFHPDLASLEGTAQRRLALISGRDFGGDGRAWLKWWTESAKSFRAHRAFIPITSADAESLTISYRSEPEDLSLHFHGDDAEPAPDSGAQTYWLSRKQCIDLYRVLEKEGLFSAERLPAIRGRASAPERELNLTAGPYEKVFFVDATDTEPWFERVVGVLRSLSEQNSWQRFFSESRRVADPGAWLEERRFWSEERGELERARRFKRLVESGLSELKEGELEAGLLELERLFAVPGVPDASDVHALRERLTGEPFYSALVTRLVGLALTAARAEVGGRTEPGAAPPESALDGSPAIDDELAHGLATLVSTQFGTAAIEEVMSILLASDPKFARASATSSKPAMRAAAVRCLALDLTPGVDEVLVRALNDKEYEVEAAAVRALGERCALLRHRPETSARRKAWSDEIESRLDSEVGKLQIAAICAMAQSGDERAIGSMLPALSNDLPAVRQAAAEGLAAIHDPSLAPVLVSLLARGPRAIVFDAARRGLTDLGAGAHDELLRIVNRREPGLSREAALILAEGGVPEVAASLLTILTEAPADERVALELAILTGVDYRGEAEPASAWWTWWDSVRQDSAEAWLFAAAERLGLRSPAEGALSGRGTREGAELLLSLLQAQEEFLVTRAERELARLVGAGFSRPNTQAEREEFLERHWPQ